MVVAAKKAGTLISRIDATSRSNNQSIPFSAFSGRASLRDQRST